MEQLLFKYFRYYIKKIFLLLFIIGVCNSLNAQTVEIGEMDLKQPNAGPSLTTNTDDTDLDYEYKLNLVFFSYDDIDTDAYSNILFNLYIDNGKNNKRLVNTISYAIAEGNKGVIIKDLTVIDGLSYDFIPGNYEITIEVTGWDSTSTTQTIVESDPWTVNYSFNHILDNTICCNQNTLSYPFDPASINQISTATVSTEDGASITSIQWQKLAGNVWSNIAGATQLSYDPPSVSADIQYRRVLTSSSGATDNSIPVSITKITEKITGNSICCSQTTAVMPFDPSLFQQTANTTIKSSIAGAVFTYQWQDSTNESWNNIVGATNSVFDSPFVKNPTGFRRIVISSNGGQSISNEATAFLQPCSRPSHQQNVICGDMTFYKIQHGDVISPGVILGAFISPDIIRREFGYDYMISYNGGPWVNAQAKQLMSVEYNSKYNNCGSYVPDIDGFMPDDATSSEEICATELGLLDYHKPAFTFDINQGSVQHIYIRRDYYQWYDPFNCGPLGLPGGCGSNWHLESQSNIATITLTTADFPKPVPSIVGPDQATCNWSDQTMVFNVPRLNNGEYYKWEIPSSWSTYTALEGPYANQISVNTNSGAKKSANGGQVCLTVTQGAQVNRQCKTVNGSTEFYVNMASPSVSACEGQTVILKPNIVDQTGQNANPANYTFSWAAYQSPIQACNNPVGSTLTDCKELKITVTNVKQNPTQPVTLTLTNTLGCVYTTTYSLVAAPGVQMGILNNPNDPLAVSTSSLAVDASSNFLYFTGANRVMWRTYFDNTPGQQIWKYAQIVDKNNINLRGDGPVAIYKGTTSSKLFYIYNGILYYAESTDNGLTWVNHPELKIALSPDTRIKVWSNNIYYITADRKVYYQAISNLNGIGILAGNASMNYSTHMFTVEDGILAYADASNNIVAFDALSGAAFTINVPATIKQVNYNSAISTYNGNIYYTSSSGSLIILKRNASTGIYDNYEEVPNLQLAGPFAINKQTGTVYAKAYDMPGKMIYYLNNQWNITKIQTIISDSPIVSDMTYANGHAFYIGDFGHISNTYYVAPCTPAVLRMANTTDENGDILNQPLSNEIAEDRTVLLYPNPANAQVKVTFTIPQESTVRINIIPVTGDSSDMLYNSTAEAGTQDVSVDLNNYAGGLYLIQLYVNGSLYGTSKLVKQ